MLLSRLLTTVTTGLLATLMGGTLQLQIATASTISNNAVMNVPASSKIAVGTCVNPRSDSLTWAASAYGAKRGYGCLTRYRFTGGWSNLSVTLDYKNVCINIPYSVLMRG